MFLARSERASVPAVGMNGSVKIGVGFGLFRLGLPSPETIVSYAERAEDLGIDSIWLSDHIASPEPHLDIGCVMSLFAARTKRIKMGPAVLTLPARHPIEVAREYATLDYLSGSRGRVIVAVGLGAQESEAAALGIPPAERAARMEEGVAVLRKLWAGPDVTHEGRFYRFANVTIEPRPAKGRLDIWIGGRTEAAIRRVARYGDGWFPSFVTPEEFRNGVQKMLALAAEAGREIDADEAGVVILAHVNRDRDEARAIAERFFARFPLPSEALAARSAVGAPEECIEKIRSYVAAGCRKFVLWPVGPPETLVSQIETYGREILPAVAG